MRLRSTAKLLETAQRGEPIKFDYAQLMKDARAEGLLGALKEEYELVCARCVAGGRQAPMADAEAKLNKSAMARIIHGEQAWRRWPKLTQQIKAGGKGKPPELAAALATLQKISGAAPTGRRSRHCPPR